MEEINTCNNCEAPLPQVANFCPKCGQKTRTEHITMRDLLINFWNNNFHLEGKFVKTAWELLIPGKVSTAFFTGKQQRYLGPLRMFGITMFFTIIILSKLFEKASKSESQIAEVEIETNQNQKYNGEDFFEMGKFLVMRKRFMENYGQLPNTMQNPNAKKVLDTLLAMEAPRYNTNSASFIKTDSITGEIISDSISLNLGVKSIYLDVADVFSLKPAEIIKKYEITRTIDAMAITQGIKLMHNPDALVKSYIGSLASTFLFITIIMAAILWLFYRKKRPYYVEHFVFMLHSHSGFMLLIMIMSTVFLLIGKSESAQIGFIACIVIYWLSNFWALKKYYNQSYKASVIKWLLISLIYTLVFIAVFVGSMFLIFLLF